MKQFTFNGKTYTPETAKYICGDGHSAWKRVPHTEEEWSLLRDESGEYYVYAVGGSESFWAVYIDGDKWEGETILPLPKEIGKAIAAEYREGRTVCFDYIRTADLRFFRDPEAEVMVCGIGMGYKNLLQIAA